MRVARAPDRPAARDQVHPVRIPRRNRLVGDRVTRPWPALLGAAIILSACASSSTTSAPTPAAAPGPTAADALGRLSIASHEQYYHIEGSSAGALREAIHRLGPRDGSERSEEHTSELQSLAYLVCRLLLEKK